MNPEAAADTEWSTIGGLVAGLARRLHDPEFPTGDHAALRRLSADGRELRHAVALYRLLEDVGISGSGADQLSRWAAIVNALALCRGAHDPNRPCERHWPRWDLAKSAWQLCWPLTARR